AEGKTIMAAAPFSNPQKTPQSPLRGGYSTTQRATRHAAMRLQIKRAELRRLAVAAMVPCTCDDHALRAIRESVTLQTEQTPVEGLDDGGGFVRSKGRFILMPRPAFRHGLTYSIA